ncbi:cytochrome c [Leptospira selangorensis]|uniref:Cytochrome c n=1 Tax=Leptospira selangorensis TaxID=2484982 RepID=A0A4R9GC04_9LEPT|nr:cytochrome c [Leptospira selangorensis]TGK09233.1 cytochrome c [Leptospira selangorensis]TGM15962.1 cytochrome c [Leptospira selangorensis]TGM18088.1 cytochrome c [Leptospira selangorensis]
MNPFQINRSGSEKGGNHRLSFFSFLLLVFFAAVFSLCKESKPLSPEAEAGRGLYMANCLACHNANPKLDGAVGPSVGNSSYELLEARMRGEYPPGYVPKRQSTAMTRFNFTEAQIKSLEEFLKQ